MPQVEREAASSPVRRRTLIEVMPVYYSAISRKNIIICDYHTINIPLERYALQALEHLGASGERQRQEIDGRLVYTLVVKELTYLCITDLEYLQVNAFNFLEKVHSALKSSSNLYSEAHTCTYYALRGSEFKNTLAKLTVYACDKKLSRADTKNKTVQHLIKKNMDKVADQGESLASIGERSEFLTHNLPEFQRPATKRKQKMECNCKFMKMVWKSIKMKWESTKMECPSIKMECPSIKMECPSIKMKCPSIKMECPSMECPRVCQPIIIEWESIKYWVALIILILFFLALIATLITLHATHKL